MPNFKETALGLFTPVKLEPLSKHLFLLLHE